MADHIRVDYEALSNIATRFTSQAEEIAEMEQAIQNDVSALQSGGWIGQGANAFYEEMESLVLPAIRKLFEALDESSQKVKAVAGIMEEAESESGSYFGLD